MASRFILDGDTAHISKTVIDGSQHIHPDSASVVSMISGEDSTPVLNGLTIIIDLGNQTGAWGAANQQQSLGRRTVQGTKDSGVITVTSQDGSQIRLNTVYLWSGERNSTGNIWSRAITTGKIRLIEQVYLKKR